MKYNQFKMNPQNLLLNEMFDIKAKQTPLILTARFGYTEIASLLVEYGAKVNAVDMDSWTPLLNASKEGNAELVDIFINNKAFIESRDSGGFTPLMWACYKNRLKCARLLIENGANVNAQCKVHKYINRLFNFFLIF